MTGIATWEQIVFVIAALVTGLTLVLTIAWFLWSRIQDVRNVARAEMDALRREFYDYRLNVSERYATHQAVLDFDKRVTQAVASVKDDIDRRFDDFQRMFETAMGGRRQG